jgi:poly-beta-1,6-N-acetyl-D-glucosamine synthase
MRKSPYVLITAARNEEAFIERTIRAVLAQTLPPAKWVIVSDGSTDCTDEIVERHAAKHDFIELVRVAADPARNFGSKAKAINFGYGRVTGLDFAFVGILDADVAFDSTYCESVLAKFARDDRLGIAGGITYDLINGRFTKHLSSRASVGGPFQWFRHRCFEDIGGYLPLSCGGVDTAAETMARMYGWKVESFPEIAIQHFRRTGTAVRGILAARFRQGVMEYAHGYHPLFELAKAVYRVRERPYLICSIFRMTGYCWAFLRGDRRALPEDVVAFLQAEQLKRLRAAVTGTGEL